MSEKEGKKKASKKATNAKKPITLRLNDGTTVNASTIYEENTNDFRISDVDSNKIKVSNKKLYSKAYDSYKRYVFYEHNNKLIPLKNFLLDVTGRYHCFNDDNKSMNFILNNALLGKFHEIFSDIEAKLEIEINDFTLTNNHGTNLKTKEQR